jgi:hypothetical protein
MRWGITYVFTHDHVSINSSKLSSDDGDLLGGYVIGINEQDVLVFLCDNLESNPVGFLLDSLIRLLLDGHSC